MGSLISNIEKAELEAVRDDIFDTFSKKIAVWITPETTIISSNANYNYTYSGPDSVGSNDYVNYTPNSGIFDACIYYNKDLERLFASPRGKREENFRMVADDGTVRIKLKSGDYYSFIKDSIDFEFDGYHFELDKTPRPHGLFNTKYITLYLKFKN